MNIRNFLNEINQVTEKYNILTQRIDEEILRIGTEEKVLIYSAGEHTERLFAYTNILEKNIIGIVDKNLEGKFLGYNIYKPKDIKELDPDIILISSCKYQEEIYLELKNDIDFQKEIVKLYGSDDLEPFYNIRREITEIMNFSYESRYNFINRSNNREDLVIILSGYKEFLYDNVFERIKKFTNNQMDVCIAVSGKSSLELIDKCKENGWSYLETKENNVSLIQNLVIENHPSAQYIYKLDEDMFITENFFSDLKLAYLKVEAEKNTMLEW